jgi:nucleoid-associated protein YgaU
MKKLTLSLLLLTLVGFTGCQNKDKSLDDAVAVSEPVDFEPVEVQAMDSAPQPLPGAPAGDLGGYTVRKGDTLWSIAKQQYGDGQRWKDILDANPGLIPEKLPVGKQIVLP